MNAPENQTPAQPSPEQMTPEQRLVRRAVHRSLEALRLASASLPHLSGLSRLCRVKATFDVNVAAVGASGLIIVQPDLFAKMPLGDAAFILAHELMHLALDTHGRTGDTNPLLGNFAHDYIINDILCEELERDEPPLGGLQMPSAREKSFEELCVELAKGASRSGDDDSCWTIDPNDGLWPGAGQPPPPTAMGRALADAGLAPPQPEPQRPRPKDDRLRRGDLLSPEMEQQLEPELSPSLRKSVQERVRKAAAKAASLAELKKKMQEAQGAPTDSTEPQRHDAMLEALHAAYDTPWQLALQRWMDAVAPGERTYARPSRRGADRGDVVLPGRRREGWTLHVILDTSGSMEAHLGRALGAIAHFCTSAGVYDIHLVQCDVEVTKDDWLEPSELDRYQIRGFGYSDMAPAMQHFREDPEITSVIMLTDGYIDILADEPPYRMLWVLLGDIDMSFRPPYGDVVYLPTSAS